MKNQLVTSGFPPNPARPDCATTLKKQTGPATNEAGCKKVKGVELLQTKDYAGAVPFATAKLPSRASLARKWPALKINRLTWRWIDDASGARGDDFASLLAFLGEGAR